MLSPRRVTRAPALSVAKLSTAAVYSTPLGRLCKLVPRRSREGVDPDHFAFVYVDGRSRASDPLDREGFSLTAANVPLLREVLR